MDESIFFNGVEYLPAGVASSTSDLSRDYIIKLCKQGNLVARQVGKKWYIERASFDTFLANHDSARAQRAQALSESRKLEYRGWDIGVPKEINLPSNLRPDVEFFAISLSSEPGFYRPSDFGHSALIVARPIELAWVYRISVGMVGLLLAVSAYSFVGSHHNVVAQSANRNEQVAAASDGGFFSTVMGIFGVIDQDLSPVFSFFGGFLPGAHADSTNTSGAVVRAFVIPYSPTSTVFAINAPPQGVDLSNLPVAYVPGSNGTTDVGSIATTSYTFPPEYPPQSDQTQNQYPPDSSRVFGTGSTDNSGTSGTNGSYSNGGSGQSSSPTTGSGSSSSSTTPYVLVAGVSQAVLNQQLNALENKLTSLIYDISAQSSANSEHITEVYNTTAQTNDISQLNGTAIHNATFDNGSITNSGVQATSLSVTGSGTSTFVNGLDISGGCFSINGTCVIAGGGGGGNSPWPWTALTNFGVTTNATTTPEWFEGGFFASSTSQLANATTTNFTVNGSLWFPSLATPAGTILAVDNNGKLIATSTSAGGVNSVSATYPVISSGGASPTISLAFGTTTANRWSLLQNFNFATTGELTATSSVWFTSLTSTLLAVDSNGKLISTTTPTASNFIATSSVASQFPYASTTAISGTNSTFLFSTSTYASTTALTATVICFTGDNCRTTWPSGGGSTIWPFTTTDTNFSQTTEQSTSTPEWFKLGLYASSTSQFVNQNIWGLLTLKATTSTLLATDVSGNVIATSTIGNNQLQNASVTINTSNGISGGGSAALGGSLSLSGYGWPWTLATNFNNPTQATTGIAWFQSGVYASSTSQIAYASSSAFSATNGYFLFASTTYASSSALTVSGTSYFSALQNALLATDGSGKLVATSTPTANSFNATSNTASQFPYASTTAISANNGYFLFASTTYASSSVLTVSGGSYFNTGKFTGTLSTNIANCSGSQALTTNGSGDIGCASIASGGVSTAGGWQTDNGSPLGLVSLATSSYLVEIGVATGTPYGKLTIGSGATATTSLVIYPASGQTADLIQLYNASQQLTTKFNADGSLGIATTTTSSSANLSVGGNTYITGGVGVGVLNTSAGTLQTTGTTTVGGFLSVVGNASTTVLSANTICFTGDNCRTTWPSGGTNIWPFTITDTNFSVAVQSTTTPEWFKSALFASSTSQFTNANIWGLLSLKATSSSILAVDANGNVIATSTIGNNQLQNSTISGISLGGSLNVLTAAADNSLSFSGSYTGATARTVGINFGNQNTWSALQVFGAGASTSLLSVSNGLATTTIFGQATSTFGAGISASYLNITGTSATSTFANGIALSGGCVSVNGTCLGAGGGGGSGTVTSSSVGQVPVYTAATTITGTSTLYVASNQFVGVGTTTPFSKLTVWGPDSSNSTSAFLIANGASSTIFSVSDRGLFNYGLNSTSTIPNNTPYAWTIATSSTGQPLFQIDTTAGSEQVVVGGGASSYVTVDSGVSFGVGTSTPGSILGVQGVGNFVANGTSTLYNSLAINGNFSPTLNDTYSLGDSTHEWKDLFVASSSIYIGGQKLSLNNQAFTINAPLNVSTTTATSTFANGLSITGGCISINGVCLAAGGLSGTANQLAYFNSGSTAVSTSTLTVTLGGNLGIGTTSPQARLEVADSRSASSTPLYISNFNSGTSSASVSLAFRTDDATHNSGTTTASITSILQQNYAGGKGDLLFNTLNAGQLTEAMRILNSGLVGIGTASPSNQLSIHAANPKLLSLEKDQTTDKQGAQITLYGGAGGTTQRGTIGFTMSADPGETFWGNELTNAVAIDAYCPTNPCSSNGIQLGAGNAAVLTVASTSGVGIGTFYPKSTLDVAGNLSVGAYAGVTAAPSNGVILSGNLGAGTTTPQWALTGSSATKPQLALTDGTASSSAWTFRNIGNQLYIATSSYTATSSVAAIAINGSSGAVSFGSPSTTTFSGAISVTSTSATSTFANGINLTTGGCFAVNNNCLPSTNPVGAGTIGQFPYYSASGQALTATSSIFLASSGKIGIGTTTPSYKLEVVDTSGASTTPFAIANYQSATTTYTKLGFRALDSTGTGTTTATIGSILEQNFNGAKGNLTFLTLQSGQLTEGARLTSIGNFGVGTTSPYRRLSVTDSGSSNPQIALSASAGATTQLFTNSSGQLLMTSSAGNIFLTNDNLSVCSGGSAISNTCLTAPTGGSGDLIVQNKSGFGTSTSLSAVVNIDNSDAFNTGANFLQIASTSANSVFLVNANGNVGIGTSTPTEQLSVANKLYVAAGNPSTMGTATSTFQGDVLITGKLDVSTIDPVYTIDGTKYATYGLSGTGVKEEVSTTVTLDTKDTTTGKYVYDIDFDKLEKGSDLWLFYQVTDFGDAWKNLVVNLTPAFDGATFYTKLPGTHTLRIEGTSSGEVSVRLVANRFDAGTWSNLRSDQGVGFPGFELQSKTP